jgi:hypothetical protein
MAAKLGRLCYLNLDFNDVGGAGADWQPIAQQTDHGFDGTTDVVDGSYKGLNGWKADIPVGASWPLSLTTKLDPTDPGVIKLFAAWKAKTAVWLQNDESGIGGTKEEGQGYITKFSKKYPQDNVVELSLEFAMQGAPVTSP